MIQDEASNNVRSNKIEKIDFLNETFWMVWSDGRVSPINTALMQIWTLYTFTFVDCFIVFIRMARNVGDSKLQIIRTKRLRLRQGDDLLERLPRRPSQLNGGQSLAQFLRV